MGVIDIPTNGTSEQVVEACDRILEEISADAYAGINAFGVETSRYQETVREVSQEREAIRASREKAKATERKTGPTSTSEETQGQADGERYSIEETDDGKTVLVVDSDILSGTDTSRWNQETQKNVIKETVKAMKALPSVVTVNGIEYKINFDTRREYTWSEYSKKLRKKKTAFLDKMRTAGNADKIVAATRNLSYDGYLKHERKDNYVDFMHGSILIQAGKNQYEGTTVVGVTRGGGHVLRDIVGMKPTSFKLKGEPSTAAASKHARSNMREDSPVSIIPRTNIESNTEVQPHEKERFSVEDEETLTEFAIGDDGHIYLPGQPMPEAVRRMRAKSLDREGSAAYDGENQKGAVDYGRTSRNSESEEDDGGSVRDENRRSETYDGGEKGGFLEAFRGDKGRDTKRDQHQGEIPEWANGHLTKVPKTKGSRQAKLAGTQYVEEVYLVDHDALQEEKAEDDQIVWGSTEDGVVFLSDQVPDDLGISVGYHEVVHVAKQKGFQAYVDFWNRTVTYLQESNRASFVLDVLAYSRFKREFMSLNDLQCKIVYDELNALVWGFYKADADNARNKFEAAFKNYDDYIRELDEIIEQMRLSNMVESLPGKTAPEPVQQMREQTPPMNEEVNGPEKFSVEDEETLAEFALGDDGHIYLPGQPMPEAVRRMQQQKEDLSQNAERPERVLENKTGGLMNRMTQEEIRAVQSIGRKSINDFTEEDFRATEGLAKRYWVEMGEKSPFFRAWFGDWRANDQAPIRIANQRGAERGVCKNRDTGWDIQISGKVFNEVKAHQGVSARNAKRLIPYINDIVGKAILLDTYSVGGKPKSKNSLLMHSFYAVVESEKGPEIAKLYVEEMYDPNRQETAKMSYQLQNIESQQPTAKGSGFLPSPVTSTADIVSVADLFEAVKRADRNFRPGISSKVVDEAGRPMEVYHGTNLDFWSFDPKLGAYWFSKENDYAEAMADERGGKRVMSAYISMKNPMHASLPIGRFTDPVAERPYIRRAKAEGYDGIIFEADTDSPIFKTGNLCYSISEADRRFLRLLTHIFSTGWDWRNVSHKLGFNIRWRDFPQEKFKANMYRVREIYLIGIFLLSLLNDYGLGNQFAEIVHGQFCKDLLENELHLFCVQM